MKYKTVSSISKTITHFSIVFVLLSGCSDDKEKITSAFLNISKEPELLHINNSFEIYSERGHFQGIQIKETKNGKFGFITGSSDSISILTIVKFGDLNKIVSVNRLMNKPFKHAGGFQIYDHYLAVGIEDNSEKNKSKVCVYDISEPEKPLNKPLAVIDRQGETLRSTAGCVGITGYKNQILIAVGDWDTKHIDFYKCSYENLLNGKLVHFSTADPKSMSKTGWVNNEWQSYQNINLFTTKNNRLFLVGLGQNKNQENVADLFLLNENKSGDFEFVKLATKTFDCTKETSFKAAAGAEMDKSYSFKIISCGYQFEGDGIFNIFQ